MTPALGATVLLTLPAGHVGAGEPQTVPALVGAVCIEDGVTRCHLLALRPFRQPSWYEHVPEGSGETSWAAPVAPAEAAQ